MTEAQKVPVSLERNVQVVDMFPRRRTYSIMIALRVVAHIGQGESKAGGFAPLYGALRQKRRVVGERDYRYSGARERGDSVDALARRFVPFTNWKS
jgi:hypothetical protein